ncbi:hypothetical protein O181_047658 [Austropuccinia psidii MF-1]|uniref:Uncharacterized protein n=1 Tax=Austropuccinia psidii MF-1 TaxID=1389203 RepID=A0A9Q3DWH1_9BASI|nr:hypothetical protein [Austropuccinia psidii MF-1]
MKVVTPVQAHSNEQYYAPKEIYIAHKLHFQSEAANTFMHFYDKVWYNSKLPEQRKNISDWKCVAFLEDLTSLCKFTTEDEKLGDKNFNDKHWDFAIKEYNLDFLSIVESKSENDDEGEEDDSDYGESIELELDNEDETQDQDDEDDITTRKKGGKGKEREIEVNDDIEIELKDEDMEIDATHNSNFIGGLTEAEWNAWR